MPTPSAVAAHQEFKSKFYNIMNVEPQESRWWNGLRDSEQEILASLIRGGARYIGKSWQELEREDRGRILRARNHVRDLCTMPGER